MTNHPNRPGRLTAQDRDVLIRMAKGWRPMRPQLIDGMRLERRGLVRLDWGPEGTADSNKMCWYITERGREAIEA